jgi:hypothetical protein
MDHVQTDKAKFQDSSKISRSSAKGCKWNLQHEKKITVQTMQHHKFHTPK